ncbi:MAG: ferrous iron transport protein A [Armatimonadota bacterium]
MRTLADLNLGECGIVRQVQASGLTRERLQDLGLVPGTRVCASLRSPLGQPVAYEVRGSLVALREEDARTVLLEEEATDG